MHTKYADKPVYSAHGKLRPRRKIAEDRRQFWEWVQQHDEDPDIEAMYEYFIEPVMPLPHIQRH